jgi:hypothetical protein
MKEIGSPYIKNWSRSVIKKKVLSKDIVYTILDAASCF